MTLVVEAPGALADGVAHGDSVAVNGVCLTVVAFDDRTMRSTSCPKRSAERPSMGCAKRIA